MSTAVGAERPTVWEALTDPEQVLRWRPGLQGALDSPDAYPRPGIRMRWRVRLHDLPLTLEEMPLVVEPGERLHSALTLGLFRFEETFTLRELPGAEPRTRLCLKITAPSEMPLVGDSLDRFAVRRFATDLASNYLQAVRDWCEHGEFSESALPEIPLAVAAGGGGG